MYVWHESFICMTWLFTCMTWLIHICDMILSYAWHDWFIYVTWLSLHGTSYVTCQIHVCHVWHFNMCDMTQRYQETLFLKFDMTHSYLTTWHAWHDSFIYVTLLIHKCAMAHSYVWHNSFIWVTSLIHIRHLDTRDMTHLYTWHDSFISVPWLIHMCDMTHSYVWHDMTDS